MEKIVSISERIEERLAALREKQRALGIAPVPAIARVCPTCKYPFCETSHGWVKDYSQHEGHAGHQQKYGYCEIPCPDCASDARRRALAHQQAELVARLFGGAHIPHQARNWSFTSFPTGFDRQAIDAGQAFIQRHLRADEDSKRGLYVAGAPGVGKTGLAICMLKAVMEAGHLGLFVLTTELMARLRASNGKQADESPDELLQAVIDIPWLVLDDLATERPTSYVLEQFYFIVAKRWQQGKYTIFTSNLSTFDLEAHWRPEGVKPGQFHAGVRIVERMREMCEGLQVKGRNIRKER